MKLKCCFSLLSLLFYNPLSTLIFVCFSLSQHVNVMVTQLSVGSVWPCISSLVESVEAFVWSAGTTQRDATASSARTDICETTANRSATARPASVSNNWFVCVFYVEIMFKLVDTWLNHSCCSTSEKKNMFFLALPSVGSEVCERQHSLCLCYGYTMRWNVHWHLPFDCSHIYGKLTEHFSQCPNITSVYTACLCMHFIHQCLFII